MALIKSVRGYTPIIGKNCFLADNCTIIGDVVMGDDCSVWFNTVLRGDVNSIKIGNRVNIQDGSVLHTLYQKSTIEIGDDVSIGHNVTIHGAKIHDFALIGMGAVVMDDAEVGEGALRRRRERGVVTHQDRCQRALGRRTRQIHQDGRPGAEQGNQPENRQKLSDVLHLVRR